MTGVYTVEVGVARSRPPHTDDYRVILVQAEGGDEADLVARQIASCESGVVMVTESWIIDWPAA
jgi:hypothetical protein